MGGEIQGKLFARNEDELNRGRDMGYDFDSVITMDDLVSSDDVFFAATGITDGELLEGVHYHTAGAETESIVVRGTTGTVRRITSMHSFSKLESISDLPY
jgi:fructose-1,6-bisphosphatase II